MLLNCPPGLQEERRREERRRLPAHARGGAAGRAEGQVLRAAVQERAPLQGAGALPRLPQVVRRALREALHARVGRLPGGPDALQEGESNQI